MLLRWRRWRRRLPELLLLPELVVLLGCFELGGGLSEARDLGSIAAMLVWSVTLRTRARPCMFSKNALSAALAVFMSWSDGARFPPAFMLSGCCKVTLPFASL